MITILLLKFLKLTLLYPLIALNQQLFPVASQSSSEVAEQLPEVEQVPDRTSRSGRTVRLRAMLNYAYFY